MFKKNLSIIFHVVFSLALLACNRPATEGQKNSPAQNESLSEDEAISSKLNAYVDCFNLLDSSAHDTIIDHFKWNVEKGRLGLHIGQNSAGQRYTPECQQKIEKAIARKPTIELDAAAKSFIDAAADLQKVASQAYTYLSREDYKDDDYAKARELKAPLISSIESFIDASEKFSTLLDAKNDEIVEKQLAGYSEKDKNSMGYFRLSMMNEAKLLTRLMQDDSFDLATATQKFNAFAEMSDKYDEAVEKRPADERPRLRASTEYLRKAFKERLRRIRDKVPYTTREKEGTTRDRETVEGSAEKVLRHYNRLVEADNRR